MPNTNAAGRTMSVEPEVVRLGEAARITNLTTSFYNELTPVGFQWMGQTSKSPGKQDMAEVSLNEAADQMISLADLSTTRWNQVVLARAPELLVAGHKYYHDMPMIGEFNPDETEVEWYARYQEWGRGGPLPLVWQTLPAESTFTPSISSKDEALSTVKSTWHELMGTFTEAELAPILPADEKDRWKEVTAFIYANTKWIAYGIFSDKDGVSFGPLHFGRDMKEYVLRTIEHEMNCCPIVIHEGQTTATKEPGKYYKGVLYDVRELIVAMDKRASEAATGSKYAMLPIFKRWLQNRGQDSEGSESDVEQVFMGDVIDLNAADGELGQENMEPLYIPNFGIKTIEQVGLLRAICAQLSGATDQLEGTAGPTNQAAWARSQIIELATSHFKPLTSSIQAADIKRYEMLIEALAVHGQRISLNPRGSKPSAIFLETENLRNWAPYLTTGFRLQIPRNKLGMVDMGMGLLERNAQGKFYLSSVRIKREYMEVDNPELEMEEELTWELLMSDEAVASRKKRFLKEVDIAASQAEAQTLEQLQQSGLPPQVIQALMQSAVPQAGGQPGQNGGGGGGGGRRLEGDTIGMLRSQQPLRTAPAVDGGGGLDA